MSSHRPAPRWRHYADWKDWLSKDKLEESDRVSRSLAFAEGVEAAIRVMAAHETSECSRTIRDLCGRNIIDPYKRSPALICTEPSTAPVEWTIEQQREFAVEMERASLAAAMQQQGWGFQVWLGPDVGWSWLDMDAQVACKSIRTTVPASPESSFIDAERRYEFHIVCRGHQVHERVWAELEKPNALPKDVTIGWRMNIKTKTKRAIVVVLEPGSKRRGYA